ncbi:MAG: RNA-binding protein [Gemmatimonas sp.]|nr:RNA-binding protein [Gemmatimonas sp.]
MTDRTERLDIVLNRLCLTRSRSEAKNACEVGAVLVGGRPARASQSVVPGDQIALRFKNRLLEIRILEVPGKSLSKKAARELFEVVRDERLEGR